MFSDRCGKPPFSVASQPYIDEASSHAAYICAVICAILGLSGNLATTFMLLGDKSIRNHSTTPFLASLALSDLMFSGFNLPVLAIRFKTRAWNLSYEVCTLYPFFLYTNIMISAFSMAIISFNRFMGIFYTEMAERIFTQTRCILMVLATWVFAMALMAIPLTDTWGQMGYEPATFACTIMPLNGKSPVAFLVMVGVVLPMFSMIALYSLILIRVKRTGKEVRKVMDKADGNKEDEVALTKDRSVRNMTLKREAQLTKTLSLICAAFMICFLPSAMMALFDPMPPCYKNANWHVASWVIFWCSAFVNPIIYVISNVHYRKVMVNLLTTCKLKLTSSSDTFAPGKLTSTWYDGNETIKYPSTRETSLAMNNRLSEEQIPMTILN